MYFTSFFLLLGAATALPQASTSSSTPIRFNGPNWPAEANVRFRGLVYGGTGCPQGSMEQGTDDSGLPTFKFASMAAQVGPGVAITKQRTNCQTNLDLLSDNYQYRIVGQYGANPAWMEARVKLDDGVSAIYKDTYYFSGSSDQASVEYNISISGQEFHAVFSDPYDGFTTPWSPCGESALNMNRQVRLQTTYSRSNQTGVFELISGMGAIPWALFEWKKC